MKPGILMLLAISLSLPVQAEYDERLAKQAGADDYGMKTYVMAFLKRGPNRSGSEEERAQLQRAHLDNINRLAEEGKLVLAGPFLDDGELRGIYIFDVSTVDEAKLLTESDPAIKAGSLVMELVPWYGSAALTQIGELHSKFAKKQI
ncbi:YciI family protein [Shewanella sp. 3B26]|uniref:YciI family protein n=1 Tax=Shewanella zhuhaiensis TaxID=2919576 RepID=A0AAJ1BGT8_9GAMM|nr:YciI family protein [Shewanella zhuhaiensis]MCH4294488.1 YciI family protein [Shewanella zhuhaiensis]